jgi:hypothetical protein
LFYLPGLPATQTTILVLVVIARGLVRSRPWAWWGALITLIFTILTTAAAFLVTTPADLLAGMHLAARDRPQGQLTRRSQLC